VTGDEHIALLLLQWVASASTTFERSNEADCPHLGSVSLTFPAEERWYAQLLLPLAARFRWVPGSALATLPESLRRT